MGTAPALGEPLPPTHVRHYVVALTTQMAILMYLDRICLGQMESSIKKDLSLSDEQVGLMLSAFFWTYALAQVPAGWLSDRFGSRNILTLYILLWSLCTGLMGLATTFAVLLIFRFGCGLAQAGAYPTSGGVLSRWVPVSARGLASGIVSTGGRIGGFIAPVLTAYLMIGGGWRPVLLLYGLVGVVVAGLFWLVVRDSPRRHPSCNDGERALIEGGRPVQVVGPTRGVPLAAILRSRGLWLSSVSQFGTNFGWAFLFTWFPRYLEKVHGIENEQRGLMTSLPLFLGVLAMLAGGWLTDALSRRLGVRWGRGLPMALTRFAATAAFLVCPGLSDPWAVTAAMACVAVATDLGTPALWAYLQDAGGRNVGSILGWGNMWGNIGAALSPLVLSPFIERLEWATVFLICAAAFLLSGVSALGIDATIPIAPPEKDPVDTTTALPLPETSDSMPVPGPAR
jgi:sugar phosphate permease